MNTTNQKQAGQNGARDNRRQANGYKHFSDCYRTINGAHYLDHISFPSNDRVKAYRAAGVRCRRFGDELYVHCADKDDAGKVDASFKD